MPDLSSEIRSIQSDERGEDVRDSIIMALHKLDTAKTNLQPSDSRPVSSDEAYKILHMFDDGTNYQYPVYDLDELTIDEPGEYIASDQHLDGFSKVTVTDFGKKLIQKNINKSGTYIAKNEDAYGYSKVQVTLHDRMAEKSITANGIYHATDDSLDGYSGVNVNVRPIIETLDAHINGTYHAPEGIDGYSTVNVDVQPNLQEKTVIENGIVKPDGGYDGLSQVIVDIPEIDPQDTFTTEDEGKVVSNGALVSQTSRVITSNGTYDTTLNNEVEVDISSGGSDEAQKFAQILGRTILGSYENSFAANIGSYAFYKCASLTAVSFPACTSIGNSAFFSCNSLTAVSFPSCMSIGSYAFHSCTSLTEASFPDCTSIDSYAFYNCTSLTEVSFPDCTSIGPYAFYNCTSLTEVSFPVCVSIGTSAFFSCHSLTAVSFPGCVSIGTRVFYNCTSLTEVSFPVCSYIGSYAFYGCTSLSILKILGSSIVHLTTETALSNTPIAMSSYLGYYGSIYVPESLYSQYLSASVWSLFSSRIVSVSETT